MSAGPDPTELVLHLETELPVADWRVGDLHLWPLVRQEIWWSAERQRVGVSASQAGPGRVAGLLNGERAWATARWRDRAHEAAYGRADVVVLGGGGVDRVERPDGSWHDRHGDPLVSLFTAEGATCLQLDPHHSYRWPRERASRLIQPRLDLLKLRAEAAGSRWAPELPGLPHALQRAGQPQLQGLARRVRYVDLAATWFAHVLRRAAARVAVFVDWGPTSLAFAQGARRARITSVELQHGVHGRRHPHYGDWAVVPPGGWSCHPDVYWVWQESGVLVPTWAAPGHRSRVLVGGNPAVEAWLADEGAVPVVATMRVLVTLQPGMVTEARLAQLTDAMKSAPADWEWWVRHHPRATASERESSERLLRATGAIVKTSEPSSRPLAEVIGDVSVHTTLTSSTVLEARQLGVASLVLDPDGAELFADEVAAGWAVLAGPGDDLVSLLGRLARQRVAPAGPTGLPTAAARQLLKGAR